MPDPIQERQVFDALDAVAAAARSYLEQLDDSPVKLPRCEEAAHSFEDDLPADGTGSAEALQQLIEKGLDAAVRSSGPRFFHFVTGGTSPAALAADWLTSTLDQNPAMWIASPLGARLEVVVLGWLKQIFGIPPDWGGVLTTGAQMANFVGLACARRWWGLQQGFDVDDTGLAGLPQMPVFTSGLVHPSSIKALGMLGVGRRNVGIKARDSAGRIDLDAVERELRALRGAPAVLIATAGEPNAGLFDPISDMAGLAEDYNSWLHVDGAFGLFAALDERTRILLEGIERAHSVIADGHKWANVPYDSAFAFVRARELMEGAFTVGAAYLAQAGDPDRPNSGYLSAESSRRARALTLWATLTAYGRNGYRDMVGRHLDLARRLAARVDEADDLERLADVPLNIVCFRYRRPDLDEDSLDDLNRRIGAAIIDDGRVFVGTTVFEGKVALRPAILNWRTTEKDVDLIAEVVRDLGAKLADT